MERLFVKESWGDILERLCEGDGCAYLDRGCCDDLDAMAGFGWVEWSCEDDSDDGERLVCLTPAGLWVWSRVNGTVDIFAESVKELFVTHWRRELANRGNGS